MMISPEALATIGTAGKWLAGASPAVVAVWKLLSHDRSLLYALAPKLGKKVDARKLQATFVAESQKAFAAELKNLVRQTDQLTQKLTKATPARRPLIVRDLKDIERRRREVEIKFAALKDIVAGKTKPLPDAPKPKADAISGHWMDQFDELIRRRNEEWRALLLKDALVREAQSPGSISPRVLWVAGVLEPEKFELRAALFDIASIIGRRLVIPGNDVHARGEPVPGLGTGIRPINIATVALADTGLLADKGVVLSFRKGATFAGEYHGQRVKVTLNERDGDVHGILFTDLGEAIARLYKATPNDVGRELFNAWVESCRPPHYSVKRL